MPPAARGGNSQRPADADSLSRLAAWRPDDQALATREQLRQIMALFPFASCVPFSSPVPRQSAPGHERTGVLLRAAAHEAPPDELMTRIEALLGLTGSEALRYADRRKGQRRAMRLLRHGAEARLEGFVLAGDTRAESWIKTLLQEQLPAQAYGRLLLVPGAKAPVAVQSRGKQVCACFNVTDAAIQTQVSGFAGSESECLASLQSALKCGTDCGSCLPELKRMIRDACPFLLPLPAGRPQTPKEKTDPAIFS